MAGTAWVPPNWISLSWRKIAITLKIPPAGVLSVTAWLRQPNCGMKEMINSAVQCVFCVLAAKAGFSFTRENFDLVFYSDAGPAGTIWITPM